MRDLWFYKWMSGFGFMNYRAKIMVMAFIGTHIPLIALASYFAFQAAPDWGTFLATVGVTLVATLAGTGLTLFVLNELLRPVIQTSKALRNYRETRAPSTLPTHFTDEVGTLMADAGTTITHLEAVRDVLEHVDATTGLMNRKRLIQTLEKQAESGGFALGVVRYAGLRRLIEALDVSQAEKAMKIVAVRLAKAMPIDAQLARSDQAEFAIVLPGKQALQAASAIGEMISAISDNIDLHDLTVKLELVAGIAVFPSDGDKATAILDHAIAAAASATPLAPTAFHSPEARARSAQRLRVEQELRHALDRNEFRLHYQPVIDLAAGTVRGAEALIRWQHPEQGLVPPGKFIHVAEASGLIDPMGLWVMRETCKQIRSWNDQGRHGLTVAINLSARQFLDPDLKDHVAEAIDAGRIEPSQLEIELTETAVMADHDHTKRVFALLRDLGVSIAIDDFGTGYASMSYLRRLPFDKLKIDREFVTDVHTRRDSQAICKALIALGEGLGLKVLAEGTETDEEVAFLAEAGCDLFQGFYFSKPLSSEDFATATDAIALRSVIRKMSPFSASRRIAEAG